MHALRSSAVALAFVLAAGCGGSTTSDTGQTGQPGAGGQGSSPAAGGSGQGIGGNASAGKSSSAGGPQGTGGTSAAGGSSSAGGVSSSVGGTHASAGTSSKGGASPAGAGGSIVGGVGAGGASVVGAGGAPSCEGKPAYCVWANSCTGVIDPVCSSTGWSCPSGTIPVTQCMAPEGTGGAAGGVGMPCGGSGNVQCSDQEYCEFPDLMCGGVPGAVGQCKFRPTSCPPDGTPMCGCTDEVLYANLCVAHMAGVNAQFCKGGTGGSSGTGGGPGQIGQPCTPSTVCGPSLYCKYADKKCGTGDPGTCQETVDGCGGNGDFVCTCAGTMTSCDANSQGVDLSVLGNCEEPADTFACGDHFCGHGSEDCTIYGSDIGNVASDYACNVYPPSCIKNSLPTCDCFKGETCGGLCMEDASMDFTLICPGG